MILVIHFGDPKMTPMVDHGKTKSEYSFRNKGFKFDNLKSISKKNLSLSFLLSSSVNSIDSTTIGWSSDLLKIILKN